MKSIYMYRPLAAVRRRVLWVPTECAPIYHTPDGTCDPGIAVDEKCCVCECRPCCCDLFDPPIGPPGVLDATITVEACGATEFNVPFNLNDPPSIFPNACAEYIGNLAPDCPGCRVGLTFFFACVPPEGKLCLGCEDLLMGIDVEPSPQCRDQPAIGPQDCDCNDGDPDDPFWADFVGHIIQDQPGPECNCGRIEVHITEQATGATIARRSFGSRSPGSGRRSRCREDGADRAKRRKRQATRTPAQRAAQNARARQLMGIR